MDTHGIRWSHTDTARIGQHVSTDPSMALGGREIMQIDSGTLGRSARGKVPLRDAHGRIVGAVSVGIAYDSVREPAARRGARAAAVRGRRARVGVLAALCVSRRLQRATHGLAFADISALLDEREAMLHGIREGVVALDRLGRVRLVNDEAQRLLGLGDDAAGRQPRRGAAGRAAPPTCWQAGSRARTCSPSAAAGCWSPTGCRPRTAAPWSPCATARNWSCSAANWTPRTACSTRCAPRTTSTPTGCTPCSDCWNSACTRRRCCFVAEVAETHRASAEEVADRVRDPLLSALLVGKSAIAAERGVALRISPRHRLPDQVVDPRDLVTVLGNLIDNALDAARTPGRGRAPRRADHGGAAGQRRRAGVPPELRDRIFTEGWTTKQPPSHRGRGLGLALVRRLAERYGGMARVGARAGGGAVFTVVLPEALGPPRELTPTMPPAPLPGGVR